MSGRDGRSSRVTASGSLCPLEPGDARKHRRDRRVAVTDVRNRVLVKGAAHVATSGRLQEQGVEHLALAVIKRSEHLVVNLRECALGLGESLRAGFGERDDVAAAILGRAPSLDEILGLEFVEQSDDVRPVHLQRARERLLSDAVATPQHRERDEVARSQAERRQHRLGPQPHAAREMVEQRAGPVRRLADSGLGGHEPSLADLTYYLYVTNDLYSTNQLWKVS